MSDPVVVIREQVPVVLIEEPILQVLIEQPAQMGLLQVEESVVPALGLTLVEGPTQLVLVQEPAPTAVVQVSGPVQQVTVSALSASISRLRDAVDVSMAGAAQGAVPVFDALTQTFQVRRQFTISDTEPVGGQDGDVWLQPKPL